LPSLSRSLARRLDMPDVLRAMHREIAGVLDASLCLFGVFDPTAETVAIVWQIDNGQERPGGSFPLGNGFTSRVIRTGEPLLIRNWPGSGPAVQVHYATDHPELPQSAITAPVIYDGRVRGVLSVQSYQPATFDEDDLAFLSAVADQVAPAIFGPSVQASPETVQPPVASVLASMSVGVLVLDPRRQLVYVNSAARRLLCVDGGSLIVGYPIDRAQDGRWPLGTRALTESVRSVLDRLSDDQPSTDEVEVEETSGKHFACSASVLFAEGTMSGEMVLIRAVPTAQAA
jgi:PAS domain-containing protein